MALVGIGRSINDMPRTVFFTGNHMGSQIFIPNKVFLEKMFSAKNIK